MISFTHVFSFPKGSGYIRMVYNDRSSGLNYSFWDPQFSLPIVMNTLITILEGTSVDERYVGGIFLYFMLVNEFIPYCGVDITNMRSEDNQ